MSRSSIRQAIQHVQSTLPATVLLFGTDAYLKKEGAKQLLHALEIEVPELNLTRFEEMPDWSILQAALGKPPLMSRTKAVVLQIGELLSTKGLAARSQPLTKMSLGPGTLFIIEAGESLDRRKAYVKQVEKDGIVIECLPLKGDLGSKFVSREANRRGLHISGTNASSLFERCEGDLYVVCNELDKLQAVCSGEITTQDMEKYGPGSPEASVFLIQDLFLSKKFEKAKNAIASLLERDASPIGFLKLITNAFRCMLIARTCRDAKFPYSKTISLICETTGSRDWQAKKAYERCTKFSADKLRNNIEKLSEIDFGVKQGAISLAHDLYALLFELFSAY